MLIQVINARCEKLHMRHFVARRQWQRREEDDLMRSRLVIAFARPKSGSWSGGHQEHFLASRILGLTVMVFLLSSPVISQEAAEHIFNNACRTCHTTREGDDRLGPNLYNIIGRKAGSLPHYNYSNAMKDAGFIWDEGKLEQFIAHPDAVVPGNNMKPFGGLASVEDRKRVVTFLRSMK
jgi:cytochrome c